MIKAIITGGFGNGTFNGSPSLVVTLGYGIGAAAPSMTDVTPLGPFIYTVPADA